MSTLSQVRMAIKNTLQDPVIEGLSAYDKINPQINYPGVVVHPDESDYSMAFKRGTVKYEFSLIVLVGGLESYISQEILDDLCTPQGSKSIPQAIYNNRSLGLSDCDAHVSGMDRYWVRYLSAHIGASLKLIVLTKGT